MTSKCTREGRWTDGPPAGGGGLAALHGHTCRMPHEAPTDPVIARTRTWVERAVIGLNLCPFAKAEHAHGRIRYVVSQATSEATLLEDLQRELLYLADVDPA